MRHSRRTRRSRTAAPPTFLPENVARAADEAADKVLAEDFALRTWGIAPPHGRAR